MELLLTLALWGVVAFVMMRMGCGAHAMGRGAHRGGSPADGGTGAHRAPGWPPPERAIDPVCGETVRTANARPSVHDGRVYYFCSRDCREIFEAAPGLYLSGAKPRQRELEHSHG